MAGLGQRLPFPAADVNVRSSLERTFPAAQVNDRVSPICGHREIHRDPLESPHYPAALRKTASRAASRKRATSVTRSSPYWPKRDDGLSYSKIEPLISSS